MNNDHLFWNKTSEKEFSGAYKKYLTRYFELPNGTISDFDVTTLKHGKFSMVLALTSNMQVVIAKQYRPGPEKVIFDMPAGMLEAEETPEEGAVREMREETGYVPGKLITLNPAGNVIGPYDSALGFYFLALDSELKHQQELDENELVEVMTMPLRQYAADVLRKGLATHADCGWLAIDYMLQHKMITVEDIR